jgi:hypothetical protein
VTLGLGLSDETSAIVVALVAAVLGAINAVRVRPMAPAAFQLVITTAAPLLAVFGWHLSASTVGALQFLIVAVLAILTRQSVTPVQDQAPIIPNTGLVR